MSFKRIVGTIMPAKKLYLCPHNLLRDRAELCPECEAKRRSRSLIQRLMRRVDRRK